MSTIDRNKAVPLYIQLVEIMKQKILIGDWGENDPIPPSVELIQQYDVSRETVRKAIAQLTSEGRLYSVQGKGTFVSVPKLETKRPKLTGFKEDMEDRGHHVSAITLKQKWVKANRMHAALFNIDTGAPLFQLDRLRKVNGVVIGIQNTLLNIHHLVSTPIENYNFESESLYELLSVENISFKEGVETVQSSIAEEEVAKVLQIQEGSLTLTLEREVFDDQSALIEYTEMIFRADKYKYKTTLN